MSGFLLMIVGQSVVRAIRSLGCPCGWRQFGQSCYMIVTDTPLNWTQARQVCLDAWSDLAVPNSKTENDFIWKLHKEILKKYVKKLNMWLGCTCGIEVPGQLKCYNDDQNEYQNLDPNKEHANNTCLTIRSSSGYWGNPKCSQEKLFLCERNICPGHIRCFAVNIKDSDHQATPYCLLGHTFKETYIQDPIQCCLACSKDPNCHSFNLSGKMCQLNNVTISQVDADKYLKENCVYYEYQWVKTMFSWSSAQLNTS